MVLCLLLQAALAADVEPPPAMAIAPMTLVGLAPELGQLAEERLSNRLGTRGYKVVTPSDIAALIGMERQKQLLGCPDDSCSSELGAALGVPLLLTSRLSKLGDRLELDVKVLRQRDGHVVARVSSTVGSDAELLKLMETTGDSIAAQLAPKYPFAWKLWVPVLTGTAALLAGGALWSWAELSRLAYVGKSTFPKVGTLTGLAAIDATFTQLQSLRLAGIVTTSVGAALVLGGVVWNLLSPVVPVSVVAAPTPGGATFALGGTF
jgi:hypothetical protein